MSIFFTSDKNKPKITNVDVPFDNTQIKREFLQELGLNMIGLTLVNNDAVADVTFRLEPFGQLITVPPNSDATVTDEIHSYLEINPDAVTGSGLCRVQLATTEELRAKGFL